VNADIKQNKNDDSLFKENDSDDERNGRPSFMKHLFKRHNFHVDFDPFKNEKTQTKTACLSVLNDVFKTFTKK